LLRLEQKNWEWEDKVPSSAIKKPMIVYVFKYTKQSKEKKTNSEPSLIDSLNFSFYLTLS